MTKPEILDVPPEETVEHFRAKGYHVGFDWRDTDAATHIRSFTVAKAARLDILQDIRAALDDAIANGETFESFRDRLEPVLRAKGWWGRRPMTDPLAGDPRTVQLGSPRRLRIIFDTNLRMAYAHGRWRRIERLKTQMPFLRYVAVRDARPRPEHRAWHGTVLPVDHPFWRTHYPPNGWRCRCIVQQLSGDDLKHLGYTVSNGPPPGSSRTRPWLNKRTGETTRIPAGIDPGFAHNAGAIDLPRDATDRLIAKIDAAPNDLARAAVGTPRQTPMFARHLAGAASGEWPTAILPANIAAAIGARSPTARLSRHTAAKQTQRHPDLDPQDYARVQHILDRGEIFRDIKNERAARGFIVENGGVWRAVFKTTKDGAETYLVTLHRARPRDLDTSRRRLDRIVGK